MPRKRVTIQQWIADALGDQNKVKPCNAIALVHVKGMGGTQEEITAKQLEGKTHNPHDLAQFFIDKATGYAQDLPGIQTFRLLFFYGTPEPENAFPFTVADGDLTGGGELPFSKHEATEKGLLGQLMNHNEKITAMALDIAKTTAVQATLQMKEMRQEVQEAQAIVRDVIFNMRKESHEWRMKELEFQRSTEERRMLGKAIPSMVNSAMGREIFPESHSDTELLDSLAMRIKPEHIKMLIGSGMMSEQEGALLLARFEKAQEERRRERMAIQVAPSEEEGDKGNKDENGGAAAPASVQ